MKRQASVISVNPFASTAGLERKISRAITPPADAFHTQSLHAPANSKDSSGALTRFSEPTKKKLDPADVRTPAELESETMSLGEVAVDSDFELKVIWEVLKTPGFHLIWYNELIYFWIFSIYCLVMVDYSTDRGCTKDEGETMLGFQSAGELVGRLVLTMLVDLRFMSNKNVVTLVLFILAGLMVLLTQVTGYLWMAGITLAISAFLSLLYILLNGLLVDYLGERRVTIGYGLASCIGGLLMSFRPQAVGYFRDHLGSYDPLMLCLAGSCLLGALLWLLEPIITRVVNKEPVQTPHSTA